MGNERLLANVKEQIDQADHAGSEEEGVSLKIPYLEEPESESERPDHRGASADQDPVDEPAVDEGAETGKPTLDATDDQK